MTGKFIPPPGGYENLLSFQKARIVYDGTVWFCKHFLEKRDRRDSPLDARHVVLYPIVIVPA